MITQVYIIVTLGYYMKNRIVIKIKYETFLKLRRIIKPQPEETVWEWFERVHEFVRVRT